MNINETTRTHLTGLLDNLVKSLGGDRQRLAREVRTASEMKQVQTALQTRLHDFGPNKIFHVALYEDGCGDRVLIEFSLQMPDDQFPMPMGDLIAAPNGCSIHVPNDLYMSTDMNDQPNAADVHQDVKKFLDVVQEKYSEEVTKRVYQLLRAILNAIHKDALTKQSRAIQDKAQTAVSNHAYNANADSYHDLMDHLAENGISLPE